MSKYAGFNSVQLVKPKRSQFDLSHTRKLTTRAGRLTPVFMSECIPGDTFRGTSEILLRLAPLLAPIYDQLTLFVHFFFVPCRLLWADWEPFITGGRLGEQAQPELAPVPPNFDVGEVGDIQPLFFAESSLADYLGVPIFSQLPGFTNWASYDGCNVDYMPFAAYQKVWYDYYRDRNFVGDDVITFPMASGNYVDQAMFYTKNRAYSHDYFTSALPTTQRGQEVLMPLAGTGSVEYSNVSQIYDQDGIVPADSYLLQTGAVVHSDLEMMDKGTLASVGKARIENIDEVILDSSDISINDLRTAISLQVWLERNEIAGSRYNESTFAHFGVKPQDSRLQRAEYIGGGRIPVKISEVVSTAYSDDGDATVPLANLAGHGITYGNTNSFRYFCPEHGFIIGIASIMSPGSYHQGLPRMFRRHSFLDYPWPTFAKLGEQEVGKVELFASPANLTEDTNGAVPLFGYQSRYADWKHIHNTNHGSFHSTLKFWTLVRDFASSPVLGNDFTLYNSDVANPIFAVNGSEDNFWCYVHNHVSVVRCLPYFGTPNTFGFV